MKRCSDCQTFKAVTEFHRNITTLDGLYNICKGCAKIRKADRYKRNRKEIIRKVCEYAHANRPKRNKANQKWAKSTKGRRYLLAKQRINVQKLHPRYVRLQAKATNTTPEETRRRILLHRARRGLVFLAGAGQAGTRM